MNVPGTFNGDDWTLSMCTFQELPSGSVLEPECLLMGRFTMKFAEWIHASLGMKPSLADVCLPDNLTRPGSPLFYSPRLFPSFSAVLCSLRLLSLQPAGEGKHQNKPHPKGSLSSSVRKHTCTLSSLCLPTSYIHPAWAWVFPLSSALNNASSLCPGPHTRIPQRGATNFSRYRAPSRLCLAPLSFICRFLVNASLSICILFCLQLSKIGDLTQHPHHSDFIRRQLHSRPQRKKCWWRGTINTAAVSGTPGWDGWEETSGTYQPPRPNIIRGT